MNEISQKSVVPSAGIIGQEHPLYFFWDYPMTEGEVRRLLREGNPEEKAWAISRILQYAKWEDIWRYLTIDDLRQSFERLQFRLPQDRELWAYALERWSQYD